MLGSNSRWAKITNNIYQKLNSIVIIRFIASIQMSSALKFVCNCVNSNKFGELVWFQSIADLIELTWTSNTLILAVTILAIAISTSLNNFQTISTFQPHEKNCGKDFTKHASDYRVFGVREISRHVQTNWLDCGKAQFYFYIMKIYRKKGNFDMKPSLVRRGLIIISSFEQYIKISSPLYIPSLIFKLNVRNRVISRL